MMKKILSLVAIAAIALSFAACDDSGVVNPEQETTVDGAFSVGPDSKVFFAKGNLQRLMGSFQTPISPWVFATHQYDTVGNAPMPIATDLFSRDLLQSGDLYLKDWKCSDIRNAQGYTWRVLSADEWLYLFHERSDAERLFGLGSVNGINGVFILPDNYWDKPANVTFTPSTEYPESEENAPLVWRNESQHYELTRGMINGYLHNTFNLDEWALLEEAGVIFLPAAGNASYDHIGDVNSAGYYWSCTPSTYRDEFASIFGFVYNGLKPDQDQMWAYGSKFSVRMVRDVQPEESKYTHRSRITGCLPGLFAVSETEQVYFSMGNLQYCISWNESTSRYDSVWRFAWDQFTIVDPEYNERIGDPISDEDRFLLIDLFGWNTANSPETCSQLNADYDGKFVDWGKKPIYNSTNQANDWRTLSADEWEYLFRGRPNAEERFGFATVANVPGLIILPDEWKTPDGLTFTPSTKVEDNTLGKIVWKESEHLFENVIELDANNFSHNTYSRQQWGDMHDAGAVFLPAAGYRFLKQVEEPTEMNSTTCYWASTPFGDQNQAYMMVFTKSMFVPKAYYHYYRGSAVRLVR